MPDGKERFVLFPNESVNVMQAKEGTGEGSFQFVWGKDAEEGEKVFTYLFQVEQSNMAPTIQPIFSGYLLARPGSKA